MRLKSYFTLSTVAVTTSIVAIVTASLFFFLRYENYTGLKDKGMDIANMLAHDPVISQALLDKEKSGEIPNYIQDYIEKQRAFTQASFFVITDKNRIRLTHPNTYKIGKRFVGDDIDIPLKTGEAISTIDRGSLGMAIRNFVPVKYNGKVIGMVCVGYLTETATNLLFEQYKRLLAVIVLIYLVSIGVSYLLFLKFKTTFLDLEPEYIVNKFKEHKLILNTIKEAIVAVDPDMNITTLNNRAMKLLSNGKEVKAHYIDKTLSSLSVGLSHLILASQNKVYNQSFQFGNEQYDAEIYPIIRQNQIKGYVAIIYRQLTQAQLEYEVEHLRHHNGILRNRAHEYQNRLNALSGLLQTGETEQAIDMIQEETDSYQKILKNVLALIEDSLLCGSLISKFNKADHIDAKLTLDPDSHLGKYPKLAGERLIVIIGNLLDNALLAAWENRNEREPEVTAYLSDRSEHIIIEIEDSGKGVIQGLEEYIFEYGVSSKQDIEEHGVGLFLVKRTVDLFKGDIDWERTENKTTIFSVYLDKKEVLKYV